DLALGLGDKRADIATTNVRGDHHATLATFTADLVRTRCGHHARHISQAHKPWAIQPIAIGQTNRQLLDLVDIIAPLVRQANLDIETPVTFKQRSCFTPTDG